MSSYDLDQYFPLKGTCFHCGRDLRHKVLDEIIERFSSGESTAVLATEYKVPAQAIELVIAHNSAAPLGVAFAPVALAKAA
jgi:DNA polymerase II large subunit